MANFKEKDVQLFLDMDLAELSEDTPLSEGDGIIEFRYEADALAGAIEKTGVSLGKIKDPRARALFLMRGFYFLGVFRGGEAARAMLLDDSEAENGRFELSDGCTDLFVDDLMSLNSLALEAICRGLGL